jgi:hypothetical protein
MGGRTLYIESCQQILRLADDKRFWQMHLNVGPVIHRYTDVQSTLESLLPVYR